MNDAQKALTILEDIRAKLMEKLADTNMKIAACRLVLDMPEGVDAAASSTVPEAAASQKSKPKPAGDRGFLQGRLLAILQDSMGELSRPAIRATLLQRGFEHTVGSMDMTLAVLVKKELITRTGKGMYEARRENHTDDDDVDVEKPGPEHVKAIPPEDARWSPHLQRAVELLREAGVHGLHVNQLGARMNIKGAALDGLLADLIAKAATSDGVKRVQPNVFAGV